MDKIISDYMKKIGKRGGLKTKENHGRNHFVQMAKKRYKKLSTSTRLQGSVDVL